MIPQYDEWLTIMAALAMAFSMLIGILVVAHLLLSLRVRYIKYRVYQFNYGGTIRAAMRKRS